MYRLTRARLTANLLAFSVDNADNARLKRELKDEVELLREEYRTLLYGGRMRLQVWYQVALSVQSVVGHQHHQLLVTNG